jgi:hypothetical protein
MGTCCPMPSTMSAPFLTRSMLVRSRRRRKTKAFCRLSASANRQRVEDFLLKRPLLQGLFTIGAPRFELGTSSPPDYSGARATGGGERHGEDDSPANRNEVAMCLAFRRGFLRAPCQSFGQTIGQRTAALDSRAVLGMSSTSNAGGPGRSREEGGPGRRRPPHTTSTPVPRRARGRSRCVPRTCRRRDRA